MVLVAGVDGCPGGWVAAVVDGAAEGGGGAVEWRLLPLAFAGVLEGLADCVRIAVDVPIGLCDGDRPCDLAAKAFLKPVGASVFLVPPRAALAAPTFADACALGRREYGKAFSVQTWQIRGRVLDATDTVGESERVVEAHPEVSFRLMTERVLPTKHSAPGLGERMAALAGHFGDGAALLRDCPAPARADDALDALACAWTARRVLAGTHVSLPDEGWPRIVG